MATVAEAPKVKEKRARERLTEKRLEALAVKAGTRSEIADDIVRELRIRVGKSGKKSWSMLYRVVQPDGKRGEMKRLSLGAYPKVSLAEARTKAREVLEQAGDGIDPAAVKAEEVEQRQTRTFEAVLDRFVELYAKPNTKDGRWAKAQEELAKKQAEAGAGADAAPVETAKPRKIGRCPAERLLADHVAPKWRGRLIETITRAEAHEMLDEVIEESGASIAREVRKHLTRMFNWAADRGLIAANPLAGMQRPELGYVSRERVLTIEELGQIWAAAKDAAFPFGDMVRLLILTGQRRSEIAGLERGWIHKEQRAVEIPAASYKTKRPHVVPLSAPGWALVEALPKWNGGDFMFTTTGGERPFSGFSKAKAALDAKIAKNAKKVELEPMQPWTLHDIRRSVATHMARLGVAQEHIERVLGHVVAGVAGTYNRYSYLDEKRAALEAWGKLWAGK
ncbi:site-specific integrase [Rhizorhapis sp.]|uniref:tyrosine-type recombinase/integrase n=1 Tax=Rhizorhapis sp. TaxID=1968842 RepID=UPI002B487784|nr:site-specific integrase [Rhizorhapis sp.]HKR16717.1 site-specific integrase [Rhizorhapis sp.]